MTGRIPGFPAIWVLLSMGTALLGGCVTTTQETAQVVKEGGAGRGIEDLLLVDCLLPGQIRQLGTRMTYLAPRRWIKTTRSDCGIRGGEFILFDRSDYKTALQSLLPKARAGDAVAQTYVGEIYEKGLGLPKPEYETAARWYRMAAEQGYRPAQVNLGLLYERGLGVSRDRTKALNWYRKGTGLDEDRVIFESQLDAEREAFQREIALRNRVAADLRRRLQAAEPSSKKGDLERKRLEQVRTSLRRDVESEAERVQRTLHAVETVKRSTMERPASSPDTMKKSAQVGKLELSLRHRSDALADNRRRLAMLP